MKALSLPSPELPPICYKLLISILVVCFLTGEHVAVVYAHAPDEEQPDTLVLPFVKNSEVTNDSSSPAHEDVENSAHEPAHSSTPVNDPERLLTAEEHFLVDRVDPAIEMPPETEMSPGYGLRPVEMAAALDPGVGGSWSGVQDWPVVAIHMSLLADGKVVAFDSASDAAAENIENHNSTRAMLWDPATSWVTRVDVDTGWNIFCSGHAHLPDGTLYLAGGNLNSNIDGLDKTHLFDYQSQQWFVESTMYRGRWYPTVTPLANGEMLITGGHGVSGAPLPYPEVRTTAGTLRALSSANVPLLEGYYPWMQAAPTGNVFLLGPERLMGFISTAATGSWQSMGDRDTLNRYAGSFAMYNIGKFLVSGGSSSQSSARTIDINSGAPVNLATGSMAFGRRQHNLTILADGTVLAIGGNSSGAKIVDMAAGVYAAELWNPATGQWTTLNSMQVTRQYHSTALLLPDGRVVSAGGGICGTCMQAGYLAKNAEVFSPPYLFKKDGSGQLAPRPVINSAPATVGYNANFSVNLQGSGTIAKVALVRLGSVTHSVNMEQRYIPLTFAQASNILQVTSPSNGNIAPPGYYMLFVIDSSGVPSVAKMVQVGVASQSSTSKITLNTDPPGLYVTLAGQAEKGTFKTQILEGQQRTLGVVSPQTVAGVTYQWVSWSDGGAASRTITIPADDRTYTAVFQPLTAPADLIFADDFEAGNLNAWPVRALDSGDLAASPVATLNGAFGLLAQMDDNNPLAVGDNRPNAERRYRARFYFDPNSTIMAHNDALELFRGFTGTWPAIFQLQFRFWNGNYQVRSSVFNDTALWQHSLWFDISDASHSFEIDWQAATAPGANNGSLTFWIDGVQRAQLLNIDNDTYQVDLVRLGAISSIDSGTRGSYYFDSFESRRRSYIGPVAGAATSTITLVTDPPGLQVTLDGQTVTAPHLATGPEGQQRTLGVVSPQTVDGVTYEWVSWSDGGAASHSITVPTNDQTYTAVFQPVVDDLIFADGFEAGNLQAWELRAIDGGDLAALPEAALVGSRGLRALLDDNNPLSVGDIIVGGEKRYRARFYFDPNSTTMVHNDTLELFRGFIGTWPAVFEIQLRYYNGAYIVRSGLLDDGTTWRHSLWFSISDAPHSLELDWPAATAPGANNGSLTFWIDGVQRSQVLGVDNDTRQIDRVRMGPISSIDNGTRGTFYFDAFESRRQNYIGPISSTVAATGETPDPTELYAWTEEPMDVEDLQQPSDEEEIEISELFFPWMQR